MVKKLWLDTHCHNQTVGGDPLNGHEWQKVRSHSGHSAQYNHYEQNLNISHTIIIASQVCTDVLLPLLHPFNGLFSRTIWVSRCQKGNTSLDWNEAIDDGVAGCSGISWTICKQSALRSRQITTQTPHHSNFSQAGCSSWCHNQQCQSTEATDMYSWVNLTQCTMQWRHSNNDIIAATAAACERHRRCMDVVFKALGSRAVGTSTECWRCSRCRGTRHMYVEQMLISW